MSLDLNDLLRDWPHEPGQVKVRKIRGADGREKLQLRIDLGLIQMETSGRPDGEEPHQFESLFEYHRSRARRTQRKGAKYSLNSEDVADLQQEGIQYYHRYISLFQLREYEGVVRDTQRNLDMFEFVARHAEPEELAESVEQFTPYVLMMNTRARASIELERNNVPGAMTKIESGMEMIRAFLDEADSLDSSATCPELGFLTEWLAEIKARQPLTKLERMQREMDHAIAAEAFEKAAELRDKIKALERKK